MKKTNYLDKIPIRNAKISWTTENDIVILAVENTGIFNRAFQLLLKKPKISYIHLDKMGSFIWTLLDGEKSIFELGKLVEEKFGEEANPLYERLVKYFEILNSSKFICWK